MSSHREAPEISKDPVADNADTYAFVSPDKPGTVTIITNYVPLQAPPGGPNFFEFGDDVLYAIHIDNNGDALPDVSYEFRFETTLRNPNTFLYNTGPIASLNDANWNKRQFFTVTRVKGKKKTVLASGLACPPCNIGPRSTPDYTALASEAVHSLNGGVTVFAGQRNDPFFVDLGSIFDLGDLRPFQNLHLIPTAAAPGVDATKTLNIHTIAIQLPIGDLTANGSVPTDVMSASSVLGIWGAASRRKMRVVDAANDEKSESGPWVQVSRLGNPLFNEVLVPLGKKDRWNASQPVDDKDYAAGVTHPELGKLLPVLYPGVFPKLAALSAPRADLEAILLTGLPAGVVPGFQNNTGKVLADMLRLNVAVPPSSSPNPLGLIGGDAAGFPNGRRVADDVVTIELRAIAGVTYPLVDKSYSADAAAGLITQGLTPAASRYLPSFPYVGEPYDGYDTPSS
jgi:Domain of unknown function (DUF4331)